MKTRHSLLKESHRDSLTIPKSLLDKNFRLSCGLLKAQQLTEVLYKQDANNLEHKFQLEIDRQATLISTINEEKADLDKRLKVVFKEHDDFGGMVSEMIDIKAKVDRENVKFSLMSKATIHKHKQLFKKFTNDIVKKLD
jgi:hypothetical protein